MKKFLTLGFAAVTAMALASGCQKKETTTTETTTQTEAPAVVEETSTAATTTTSTEGTTTTTTTTTETAPATTTPAAHGVEFLRKNTGPREGALFVPPRVYTDRRCFRSG